jgi:hypothetical protein
MQNGIWVKSDSDRPRFIFICKPGVNADLKDPSNPLTDHTGRVV